MFGRAAVSLIAVTVVIACVAAGCSKSKAAGGAPTASSTTSSSVPNPATTGLSAKGFAVTPINLTVKQPVSFSGAGCPFGDRVVASIGRSSVAHGTQVRVIPHADGTWNATTMVDDSTQVGERRASAVCIDSESGDSVLRYTPVDVTVATFRHLYVAPDTTVQVGTTLTVIPTAPCPEGFPAGALIALQTPDSSAFNDAAVDGSAVFDLDAAGRWSGEMTVSEDTAPGVYVLDAICVGPSRTFNAWYESVPITVTARTGGH